MQLGFISLERHEYGIQYGSLYVCMRPKNSKAKLLNYALVLFSWHSIPKDTLLSSGRHYRRKKTSYTRDRNCKAKRKRLEKQSNSEHSTREKDHQMTPSALADIRQAITRVLQHSHSIKCLFYAYGNRPNSLISLQIRIPFHTAALILFERQSSMTCLATEFFGRGYKIQSSLPNLFLLFFLVSLFSVSFKYL
ncbi:hypothetical protein FB192DRAFT_1124465 [Mucor lusitanicus]|uniref:Uncharacterized protein n=1 Tax=Mucor circinelloides f. lusitanicus TaxID=29924 RepID=A0A8H4F1V4_MUCCL|nr:hypothetical protein FB192DRAFT_1124465 [Mucor lusitanicus]